MAFNESQTAIKKIKVSVSRLKDQLKQNKTTHRTEYEEAAKGFKEALLAKAEAELRRLRKEINKIKETDALELKVSDFDLRMHLNLQSPLDRSKDYDVAIDLMSWTTDQEVELSVNDFNCYVRDEWDWKMGFKDVHATYVGTSKK